MPLLIGKVSNFNRQAVGVFDVRQNDDTAVLVGDGDFTAADEVLIS